MASVNINNEDGTRAVLDQLLITRLLSPDYECDVFLPEYRTESQAQQDLLLSCSAPTLDEIKTTAQGKKEQQFLSTQEWTLAPHDDLQRWLGPEEVRAGLVQEGETEYEFQLWTRDGQATQSPDQSTSTFKTGTTSSASYQKPPSVPKERKGTSPYPQAALLRLLNNKSVSTMIKQGAEAKVYKSAFSPEAPTLILPGSSASPASLPALPPVLLKYRFPKTYRHPSLSSSITASRTIGEVRALVRCLRNRVNVPKVVLVDEQSGVIALEWIDGKSVRELLGGGAEDADEEATLADQDSAGEPLLGEGEQIRLMELIGVQLAKMHSADVIHGDLTTSNMMVRTRKQAQMQEGLPDVAAMQLDDGSLKEVVSSCDAESGSVLTALLTK